MLSCEKRTLVDAPVDKVFTYLADFTRHPEWAAHRLKIEPTSQGPVGIGSTFASSGHQMGRENENKVVVTEFVANEKLVFEAEGQQGRFRHSFEVQPANGGARLTKRFEPLRLSLMAKLMAPVLILLSPRGLAGDLQRIKSHLE